METVTGRRFSFDSRIVEAGPLAVRAYLEIPSGVETETLPYRNQTATGNSHASGRISNIRSSVDTESKTPLPLKSSLSRQDT